MWKPLHGAELSHYIPVMSNLRIWRPVIGCLLVLWLGVFTAVRIISSGKPSTASTLALLDSWPGAGASEKSRREWIDLFASRLATLDPDSRHLVLMTPRLRSAFIDMSADDEAYFLSTTEQPGMKAFLEGTKLWNRGRYERLIRSALSDLDQLEAGTRERMLLLLTDSEHWNDHGDGIDSLFKDSSSMLNRFKARPLIERVRKYSEFGQ